MRQPRETPKTDGFRARLVAHPGFAAPLLVLATALLIAVALLLPRTARGRIAHPSEGRPPVTAPMR